MEKKSVKRALDEAEFRLRPMQEPQLRAIVRALLTMTRSGVLVTGLDHTALGCNSEFGRIFAVDTAAVPHMAVDELRSYVLPRLTHPEAWLQGLDDVYADPGLGSSDEVELFRPHLWIRRHSAPLIDSSGHVLGRLWTFDDISAERWRAQRSAVIQRLSAFHDPDPRVVYNEVVESIANLYQSPTFLSIRQGEEMHFAAVALPPAGTEGVAGNQLSEAFCQLVMAEGTPILVQDGRKHPTVCNILPVRLGFVRYLGVPVMDSKGTPIGTLCILDDKSDEILGAEDAEFMAVVGNRVSVELERERLYDDRTREQRMVLERQTSELAATQAVLVAMNRGIALAESAESEAQLLTEQEKILDGLLGFTSVRLRKGDQEVTGGISQSWLLDGETFSLAFSPADSAFGTAYVLAHVSAIADQIALTLSAFRLQGALKQVQYQLLGAEKLSVVGALAATVAHDIRNIMTSIAIEAGATGDPEEALRRVRQQVERFSVLSHRLLSYVKPKFVAREPTDLNAVLRRAIELLEPQVRVGKIDLSVDLDTTLPLVDADPNQVEHLFVNLLVNALQAVSRADGELRLTSAAVAGAIVVSLQDNGRGIPPEALEKIFDPFYSSRPDGFGLGLFSCRRIAQEHGWKLEALSELGQGSEFRITIPMGAGT